MTRLELIKAMNDPKQAGHYLCEVLEAYSGDKDSCEVCPVRDLCKASEDRSNGWIAFLSKEAKTWEVERYARS